MFGHGVFGDSARPGSMTANGGSGLDQTAERDRVKARIRALTEKTVSNGCTEAEALAAAEMVGRLLERYALSMDEIELRETRCVQMEVPSGARRRRAIDGCVPAIARFCDCKVWLSRGEAESAYVFFGFPADAELARYLFLVIARAMRSGVAAFGRANPALREQALRRAGRSFQQGMAMRIADRLEAMHAARERSFAAQRSGGTALILAKHQVVQAAFREAAVRLVSGRRAAGMRVDGAFRQGQAAGDRVNLNRPVGEAGRRLVR